MKKVWVFLGIFSIFLTTAGSAEAVNCRARVAQFLASFRSAHADRDWLVEWAATVESKSVESATAMAIDGMGQLNLDTASFVVEYLSELSQSTSPSGLVDPIVRLIQYQLGVPDYGFRNRSIEYVGSLFAQYPHLIRDVISSLDFGAFTQVKTGFWFFVIDAVHDALENPALSKNARAEIVWALHQLRRDFLSNALALTKLDEFELKREIRVLRERILVYVDIVPYSGVTKVSDAISWISDLKEGLHQDDKKLLEDLSTRASTLIFRQTAIEGVSERIETTLDGLESADIDAYFFSWGRFYNELDTVRNHLHLSFLMSEEIEDLLLDRKDTGSPSNRVLKLVEASANLLHSAWERLHLIRDRSENFYELVGVVKLGRELLNWEARIKAQLARAISKYNLRGISLDELLNEPANLVLRAEIESFTNLDDHQRTLKEASMVFEFLHQRLDLFEIPEEYRSRAPASWVSPVFSSNDSGLAPQSMLRMKIQTLIEAYEEKSDEDYLHELQKFAGFLRSTFDAIEGRLKYQELSLLERFVLHKRLYRITLLRDFFKRRMIQLQIPSVIEVLDNIKAADPSFYLMIGSSSLDDYQERLELIQIFQAGGTNILALPTEYLEALGRVTHAIQLNTEALSEVP